MSELVFCIGEFFFDIVKVWAAYDLIDGWNQPKRGKITELVIKVITAGGISGITLYNVLAYGDLFSNNMLWFTTVVMVVSLGAVYKIRVLDRLTIVYLFWVSIHIVDFFVQSLVYYALDICRLSPTALLKLGWKRGIYLIVFSVGIVVLKNELKKIFKLFRITKKERVIEVSIMLVATFIMVYFQRIYILLISEQYMTRWMLFWLFIIVLAGVSVVSAIKMKTEEHERLQEMKLQLLETNYVQTTKLYKEKATLLHDEKHHINVIYEMLSQGDIGRAMQYTQAMSAKIEMSGTRIWSNHNFLDMILNMKSEEARNNRIDIRFDDMSELLLSETDICALVSNLLDNAIEANQKIEEPGERWIRFFGEKKGKMWILNISNPIGEQVLFDEGKLVTSKKDKRIHGFGMESIQSVLDKYSGDMEISVESGKFVLTLYLLGFN